MPHPRGLVRPVTGLGHGQRILPMQLPQTSPRNDPVVLWALQQNLLFIAEAALGVRDTSKKIYTNRDSQAMGLEIGSCSCVTVQIYAA